MLGVIVKLPPSDSGRITMKEGFYLLGLEKTSPTFAAAMQNSVPALTFLMAALLRQATIFNL